jgi:hypothetical protein
MRPKVNLINHKDGSLVSALIVCPMCKQQNEVIMTPTQCEHYIQGVRKVQEIFPDKSAADRELLISGTCDQCFDKMFKEDGDA